MRPATMAYVRRNSSAALGRASDARITLRVAERLQPKPLGSATLKHRQPARGQADMKNRFLASLALAAMIAAPATAADLPYKAPPPLAEAYYDWSGAYVGLNVGGTHYNVTHHFPSPGAVTPDVTTGDHDAIFGIHAGAQWQWGAWVLGAELARSGCSHECRSTSSVLPVAQGFEENIFGEHKIIDLFTAGARLGYAWDRLLVFATGASPPPISRTRIARPSPVFAARWAALETASSATTAAGMRAAASTTWPTRARWST